jgi:hypothetical protein
VASGLQSANLKLIRAAKHLRALKRHVTDYAASKPHKIVSKPKGKKTLNIRAAPPEIAILAGEMLYQMRSALDHLAFELVQLNPNIATIDPDWREHTQFPLRTKLPKNCTPPLAKGRFSNDLPGISNNAFAFIESLQPYNRGTANTWLGFLCELSNIDKHRYLNVIRGRTIKSDSLRSAGGHISSRHALDHGAEIEPFALRIPSESPVYMKRRFRTFVTFNEKEVLGDANGLPIDYVLQSCLETIQTHIVPALKKFIKSP